ncbi:MAG: hypothetical protein RDV48_17975 [Candidatus Eremiobacteraeota bacterium]|nr:hypothetical protein [Candidatus Eremiobacteraeota bacterium]
MPWDYNTDLIVAILEEAGFDAIVAQTVNGIRDDGETNHQVYINSKGRIRYQYSEILKHETKKTTILARKFDYDLENRNIINIMGELKSTEELVDFLKAIPSIVKKG